MWTHNLRIYRPIVYKLICRHCRQLASWRIMTHHDAMTQSPKTWPLCRRCWPGAPIMKRSSPSPTYATWTKSDGELPFPMTTLETIIGSDASDVDPLTDRISDSSWLSVMKMPRTWTKMSGRESRLLESDVLPGYWKMMSADSEKKCKKVILTK